MPAESKPSSFEAVFAVIALVSPHLSKLGEPGLEAATSQKIVAAAAEFLSSKGRPGLAQMAQKLREQRGAAARSEPRTLAASSDWLVLLATLPGDDLKRAEGVANEKLRAAATPP